MKVLNSRTWFAFLAIVTLLFLTGCASAIVPPVAQGERGTIRVECATAVTGLAIDTTACAIDSQAIDPQTGKNTGKWGREVRVTSSASLGGEVIKGVVAGTGAAIINGEYAESIARKSACANGSNCGTVINAVSQSGSSSESNVHSNLTAGGSCTSSACTGQ